MHRWIALMCMAGLVIGALVTVVDASWRGDGESNREDGLPKMNGVTPTAPPTPAPTPTSVPTPPTR